MFNFALTLYISVMHMIKKTKNGTKGLLKKQLYLVSILIFEILFMIRYNFDIRLSSYIFYNFQLMIKFSITIAVILFIHYIFSKAVKGFKDKARWKKVMKWTIVAGVLINVSIFVYL